MYQKLLPKLPKFLFLLILCIAAITPVMAQSAGATTASFTGVVTDQSGASISGAVITIKEVDTNLTREVVSPEAGSFLISQLSPGNYEVTVMAEGFKRVTSRFDLLLGNTTFCKFSMVLGTSTEIVEVNGDDFINEGHTESSTNIDEKRIEGLPINRRNFLDFSLTAARVVIDRLPLQGVTATSGISLNGQSARENNITIDGLDNNESASGAVRATFSQDAVQEFQIISDNFTAEFGRALGGVVNIVTKGGSNDYHGSLFVLNRNDKISARDAFASFRPPFSQYQFGATVGGPIKKDKVFFFTSFERLSIKQNKIITIRDETISAFRDIGFGLRNGPVPFSEASTTLLGRADIRLSANDTLFTRYNFAGAFNGAFDPFGGLLAENKASLQILTDKSLAVSNTYLNSHFNLVNETRFLYGRRNQLVKSFDQNPNVDVQAPEGFVSTGRATTIQPREERIYQIVDNVTLTRGRNLIKFGVDYNYTNLPNRKSSLPVFFQGSAQFNSLNFLDLTGIAGAPTLTGLQALDPNLRTPAQKAFLTFLAGVLPGAVPGFPQNVPLANASLPLIYVQGFGDPAEIVTSKLFSVFAQDDIKLRPNLVLKAGIRYDLIRASFTPSTKGSISPRISIAYRPDRWQRLSFHAAYGLFFGVPPLGSAFTARLLRPGGAVTPVVIPFPFSILPFAMPGHKFPVSDKIPAGINVIPQLGQTFQFQSDLHNSYTQQTKFGFDLLLDKTTVLSFDYNFIRGIRLFATRDINPVVRPVPNSLLQSLITGRTDPTRGRISEFETASDSYFHGFTISLNRRFSNRIGLLANYTISKTIDDLFDLRTDVADKPVNPLRPGDERSLSLQDVRNRFVLSAIWNLDYTKRLLLRDFQVSTILNLSSGRPYNLLAGSDLNMNGDSGDGDRPANLGRNVGITPGFANVDIRLTRKFTFKERYRLQGTVEVFNLFNRTNIGEFNRMFPIDAKGNFNLPPTKGGRFVVTPDRYTNAFAPRQFQLGLRATF